MFPDITERQIILLTVIGLKVLSFKGFAAAAIIMSDLDLLARSFSKEKDFLTGKGVRPPSNWFGKSCSS